MYYYNNNGIIIVMRQNETPKVRGLAADNNNKINVLMGNMETMILQS